MAKGKAPAPASSGKGATKMGKPGSGGVGAGKKGGKAGC